MKRSFPHQRPGRPAVVGCLHLLPLPGSARWGGDLAPVRERALRELDVYLAAGLDGVIVENMHDAPYLRGRVDPGTVAAAAVVAADVRARSDVPVGVQLLAGADVAALEVAVTCDLDFVRCEGFAFAHVADEGLIQADAGRLLRRRAHLGAADVAIWADVKKKHAAHALTGDLDLRAFAEGAVFCGADALVVTGRSTGVATATEDVAAVRGLDVPVVVGSGVTPANVADFTGLADVLVVGSTFKEAGRWSNPVAPARVRALMERL